MNMLTVDPDPPNPISSFLRTLTLNDSREPFVLPVIEDSDLYLSDLGLEEVFMTNNEPKVEEEDDVLRPENSPSPPPPIFPPPPFIPDYQTRLAYSPTTETQSICLLSTMLLLPDGMMRSLTCILGVLLNFKPQMPLCLR